MDEDVLFSVNEYPTDGVQVNFEVSFTGGYISKEHVHIRYFNSVGAISEPAFTWVGDFEINVTPAPAAGGRIRIYRVTPADLPLVDFSDGSVVNEQTLDLNAKQAVFLAAEVRDIISTAPELDDILAAGAVALGAKEAAELAATTALDAAANAEAAAEAEVAALVAALAGNGGSATIGYIGTGASPLGRTVEAKLREARSLLDKIGAVADGVTSNNAAFAAAVADGGVWYIPKQAQPYVLNAKLPVGGVTFIFEDGVDILWTGGAAAGYDYVIEAGDNFSAYCKGEWTLRSIAADKQRFSVIVEAKAGVTIQGLRSVNMCRVWSKSSTGGTPQGADVYASVITSGGSANVSRGLRLYGGGATFTAQPTGVQTHAADSIFYTLDWRIEGATYYRVTGGIQWWGGNANGEGAVANERKCGEGWVVGCEVYGALGAGIWGSMGRDIEVNISKALDCEDVALDCEGGVNVRFNASVGSGHNGGGAAFFLNRDVEFNACVFLVFDAQHDAFQINNVAQSVDNYSITLRNCLFKCTDTKPSRINPGTVRYLNIFNPVFINVLCVLAASNNHVTNLVNPVVILPNVGGTPSVTVTADATSNEITLASALRGIRPYARVRFTTTGTLPAPLATGTDYIWTPLTATTGKLSTSLANGVKVSPVYVDLTTAGTGVHTMQVALSAIDVGLTNQIAGVPGNCLVSGARVLSAVTQPAGSAGVYVSQADFNSSPFSLVENSRVSNMPIDLWSVWAGENAGQSGRSLFSNNITGNNIQFTQDNAGAVGSFYHNNCRDTSNVLFNRAAHISDPSGGATIDDEARAAIVAILDILEGTNSGLMAP